jgi:Zn-dependent M28 family amino/carboxypeptidase
MIRTLLIAPAFLLCTTLQAQQQHLDGLRRQTLGAHLSFLAADALEGRQAGKPGARIAAEYIRAVLRASDVKPFFDDEYLQPFEAFSPAREANADFQVHPDSTGKYKQLPAFRRLNLRNVVGVIEGQRRDEFVVIGAHYDHVGTDEFLVGDAIYNGADDNAASVAALLHIAGVFARKEQQPLRTILFAFWDGEEVNYLGSEYFVQHFDRPDRIRAYINLDMISRQGLLPILYPQFEIPVPTPRNTAVQGQFHLVYTGELEDTGQRLQQAIRSNQLPVEPKPSLMTHGSRGSDYLAFSLRRIPILWFFTGLHPDYHTPADEAERIDTAQLLHITKAIYLAIHDLANH